jgi:hypothetical protein
LPGRHEDQGRELLLLPDPLTAAVCDKVLARFRGVSEVNKEPWIDPATLSCVRYLTLSRIDRPLLALATPVIL